jgi:membrane protease YdiL (CAAX protease family)
VNGETRCAACGRKNRPEAKFCRQCGVPILRVEAEDASTADEAAREPAPNSTSVPALDEQRIFRELCWLCGVPIALSVVFSIFARVQGASALADVLATAAMSAIAGVGAAMNADMVRAGLRWPKLRDWLTTLLVALVLGPALVAAFFVLERLGFRLYTGYLTPFLVDRWPLWVGFVEIAVATPIAEELLFRGVIQTKLEQLMTPRDALIVQAALFSATHLGPTILLTHFAMGLAFGFLRRRSGSVFPGMVLHGAWNAWVLASSPLG